jgi:hypothetical protein
MMIAVGPSSECFAFHPKQSRNDHHASAVPAPKSHMLGSRRVQVIARSLWRTRSVPPFRSACSLNHQGPIAIQAVLFSPNPMSLACSLYSIRWTAFGQLNAASSRLAKLDTFASGGVGSGCLATRKPMNDVWPLGGNQFRSAERSPLGP